MSRRHNDEEMRSTHLEDQAESFGCKVEKYKDNNAVYLRNVPGDLHGDKDFEQFVEECQKHNTEAIRTWKERG